MITDPTIIERFDVLADGRAAFPVGGPPQQVPPPASLSGSANYHCTPNTHQSQNKMRGRRPVEAVIAVVRHFVALISAKSIVSSHE